MSRTLALPIHEILPLGAVAVQRRCCFGRSCTLLWVFTLMRASAVRLAMTFGSLEVAPTRQPVRRLLVVFWFSSGHLGSCRLELEPRSKSLRLLLGSTKTAVIRVLFVSRSAAVRSRKSRKSDFISYSRVGLAEFVCHMAHRAVGRT